MLEEELVNFYKEPVKSILYFAGQMVFVPTTQLCFCSAKAQCVNKQP